MCHWILSKSLKPAEKLQLWTCLQPREAWEDINLISFFWLNKLALPPCRGIPHAAVSLLHSSSLHVLHSAFWWWNFFPFFTPCSRWVCFPPIVEWNMEQQLWSDSVLFLFINNINIALYSSYKNEGMQAEEYLMCKGKRTARTCRKRLRIVCKKAG